MIFDINTIATRSMSITSLHSTSSMEISIYEVDIMDNIHNPLSKAIASDFNADTSDCKSIQYNNGINF